MVSQNTEIKFGNKMKIQICLEIERAIGKKVQTPKDFEYLRERIYARLHILISSTTLKRIWGYLEDDVHPRESTLDILARFLCFADYQDFQSSVDKKEQQSSPVLSRKLNVIEELRKGDQLLLAWQPDRICRVQYCGNLNFEVLYSEKTRLKEGDTFQCGLFIEGEPLFIDKLVQNGGQPVAYVCGKKAGIRFEKLGDLIEE